MKLGPSSGPAVSSLEVYTTPALQGYWVVMSAPLRAGILQTLAEAVTQFMFATPQSECCLSGLPLVQLSY
jgi:hypothetical protein